MSSDLGRYQRVLDRSAALRIPTAHATNLLTAGLTPLERLFKPGFRIEDYLADLEASGNLSNGESLCQKGSGFAPFVLCDDRFSSALTSANRR